MSNLTVKKRIILLLIISIFGIIALYGSAVISAKKVRDDVVFPDMRKLLLDDSKLTLKALVQSEIGVIKERIAGENDKEKLEQIIEKETDLSRFFEDKSGYYFAYDFKGKRINVPTNKSKNGQNFINLQDLKGNYLVKDLINAARSGGGFVTYYFEKPGAGVQPKLSYAEQIPGTDIFIGTGFYIDNIESRIEEVAGSIKSKEGKFNFFNLLIFFIVLGFLLSFGLKLAINISYVIGKSVKELHEGTTVVTQSSSTVASASQELASGSSEQASSLEEVSASLEELSAMTQQNADNSRQANTLSTEADNAARSSGSAMQKMTQAISEIQQSSHETQKIIKDIDEIAFQTNLLALNAAVEAARAGEAGKGFAVVAEEVRNLAMRSAEAAKNTSDMIEQSVKNAENGGAIVKEVDDTLKVIQEAISKVSSIINEIDSASREQAEGIAQVNTAMTEIDAVTQRNAANAEESAASSEEMSSQAAKLEHIVRRLASLVGGVQNASSSQYVSNHSQPAPRVAAPRQTVQHQPLKRPPAPVKRPSSANVVNPQSVIPLDDNDMDLF